jgi:hypothetical protein
MKLSEIVISHAKEINTNGELRLGQSYSVSLFDINPYVYYKVTIENSDVDCFYLDGNIEKFLEFIDKEGEK